MELGQGKIEIFVSGKRFEMKKTDIFEYPNSLLAKLLLQQRSDKCEDLVFDRPLSSFKAILACYQTNKMHMPHGICPEAFREELEFWGFDPQTLEHCCLFKYLAFVEDVEQTKRFQELLSKRNRVNGQVGHLTTKQRMWSILDNTESSIWAKVYLTVALGFVFLSMASLSLGTLPAFNKSLTTCQMLELMESTDHEYQEYITKFLEQMSCNAVPDDYWEKWIYDYFYGDDYDNDYNFDTENVTIPTIDPTIDLRAILRTFPKQSVRLKIFEVFDYLVIAFFTVELILRLVCCPSIPKYFTSVLNCIDALILICAYTNIIVEEIEKRYKYEHGIVDILVYFRILRAFRIIRVVRNVAAMKVLLQCIKTNYKDLLVLLLLMFIGVNLFANVVYFVEDKSDFDSIPQAWWWGIVTMTTVGYGDLYPKTTPGKIAGGLCAISGVILLALVIPVFVNTFISLYQFAQLNDKLNATSSQAGAEEKDSKLSRVGPVF